MKCRLVICVTVTDTVTYILRDQPRFLSRYFDTHLISGSSAPGALSTVEEVTWHLVPMKRRISLLKDIISLIQMIVIIRRLRPNIVHSYTPKAGLVSMMASWMCRVPVRVHTFTGLIWPTSRGVERLFALLADRAVCAFATDVIAEGEGIKKVLTNKPVDCKDVRVIGFGNIAGVDTDYFSRENVDLISHSVDLRREYNISTRDFVFTFIGRLNIDKGISELITAFKKSTENSWHLLIVGSIDSSNPVSKNDLSEIFRHPRVHLLGFREDVRPSLLASDVLVLPSYREGFPNVLLQAGAMEVPVISTDIPGSNEIVKEGFNGWLVKPKDSDALFEVMQSVYRLSAADRKAVGDRGRLHVLQKFKHTDHWQRILKFYIDALRAKDYSP